LFPFGIQSADRIVKTEKKLSGPLLSMIIRPDQWSICSRHLLTGWEKAGIPRRHVHIPKLTIHVTSVWFLILRCPHCALARSGRNTFFDSNLILCLLRVFGHEK